MTEPTNNMTNRNLTKEKTFRKWTNEEVELLKRYSKEGRSVDYIAKKLKRSKTAVYTMRSKEGIRTRRQEWTIEEVDYLKNNYMHKTDKEIGEELNKLPWKVNRKRRELNLFKSKREWGDDELKRLSYLYWSGESDESIAKELGRALTPTIEKRRELDLRRGEKDEEVEYALYDGDDYIAQGTIEELADKTGLAIETLNFYRYPSSKERTSKELVRLD